MRNLTLTLVVAIAVMGGFYTGFRYEKSKADAATTGNPTANLGAAAAAGAGTGRTGGGGAVPSPGTSAGGGGGGGFGRGTFGTVASLNGTTLTLKDAQGADVKVQLQGSTTVTKTVAGSTSDLAQGVTVTVAGQRAADGTITATSITIVPAGTTFGGGGGGRGAPGASPSPGG